MPIQRPPPSPPAMTSVLNDRLHHERVPIADTAAFARCLRDTIEGVLDVVPITATITMLRFDVVNAYAVRLDSGFAIVDTGPLGSEGAILAALAHLSESAELRQIVLTHSHKDHAGSARALAELTGAIVLAGESDAPVITGTIAEPEALITAEERPFYDRIAPMIPPAAPVHVDRAGSRRQRPWLGPSDRSH